MLGNCSDEFDGSGKRSRAILALLFIFMSDAGPSRILVVDGDIMLWVVVVAADKP
jgi:hypothetical protein